MNSKPHFTFKTASEPAEMEQIHRLNYRTFAEEIPQHARNAEGQLVDKFHEQNTYVICLNGSKLAGMAAVRGARPFSLDEKLPDLDSLLPRGRMVCEIRLLAVEKEFRRSQVLVGLLGALALHVIGQGYDSAIISGTTRQAKLYQHMGFQPFGPLVGSGDAVFQPMFLSLEALEENANHVLEQAGGENGNGRRPVANFLPGPVAISPDVKAAFESAPVSHRLQRFVQDFRELKDDLCRLTQASRVEIMLGSGTLANEVVCSQLQAEGDPGLIVSMGEFGERLIDHAVRQGLEFESLRLEWGQSINVDRLGKFLDAHPGAKWLWTTHCETSSGVLTELESLKKLCDEREIKLCLDAISSIGVLPVDLRGVYLASGTSGKGLASYPGLALVYYHHEVAPFPNQLPRYLDLGFYAAHQGIPFTHSSNLVDALKASLDRGDWLEKFERISETSVWLRRTLHERGFKVIADDQPVSPAVVTIEIPSTISARSVGWQLQKNGFLVSCHSQYLLDRNWLQICIMGEFIRDDLTRLIGELERMTQTAISGSGPRRSRSLSFVSN